MLGCAAEVCSRTIAGGLSPSRVFSAMASSSNNTDGPWEKAEDEEMGLGEADAPLPTDAEHVVQPVLPLDLNPVDVDHYITEIATKVNLLGMDLWKQSFPTPDDDDYYHNPKDLPTFWGIAPEDFNICDIGRGS